uniref:Wolframin cysteine-rich domain-containing protein n=1 Tax=Romanomermis culicivorax TaxID=13658 RepID=A0A915JXQ0_ROMCU
MLLIQVTGPDLDFYDGRCCSRNRRCRAVQSVVEKLPPTLLHKVHERKMTDAVINKNSFALLTRGCDENVRNLLIPPETGRKFSRQESTISTTSDLSFRRAEENVEILGQKLTRLRGDDDGQEEIHQIARYFQMFQSNVDLDNFEKLIGSATVKSSLEIVVDFFLENVQREWGYFFDLIVPIKQLHALMVIGFLQLISFQGFLYYIPFLLLYGSFFSFIYFTLQLLHTKHSMDDFVAWKRLLNIFTAKNSVAASPRIPADLNLAGIHWRCCSNVVLSLTIFLLSFQYCGFDEKSSSKLFILFGLSCLCTTMATLEALDCKNRCLNRVSLILGFLFLLSKKCDTLFASYGTVINISNDINMKIDILSLIYIICLATCAFEFYEAKNSEKKYFVAYLLCFIWWLTTLTLLEWIYWANLEKIDILFAISLAWLYLSPKFGIFVFLFVLFFWYSLRENSVNFLKTVFTLVVIAAPLGISKFFAFFTADQQKSGRLRLFRNRKNLLIIFYGFLVVGSAMFMYRGNMMPNFHDSQNRTLYSNLSWAQFEKICDLNRHIQNETENQIRRQIECLELNNVPIFWSGVIKNVKIARIDNFFETIFSFLPEKMSHWLACLYGAQNEFVNHIPPPRPCTLRQHNVYTFHIEVQRSRSAKIKRFSKFSSIILVASDFFKHAIDDWDINRTVNFAAKFDGYPYHTP